MTYSKRLWMWLGAFFLLSFAILGLIGREIYVKVPPVAGHVVSASGATLYARADIETGRAEWQTFVPSGIYQANQRLTTSVWHARSPEIVHAPVMQALVWLRMPGDVVFSIGALSLALFALKLLFDGRNEAALIDPTLVPVE
jgi:nitric oxide reductase large subunit